MLRILALLLLAVLFWLLLDWLYTKAMGSLGLDPRSGRARRRTGPQRSDRAEPLVRCGACGTYVPTSRALSVGRVGGGQPEQVACSEICRHHLRTG